MQQFDDDPAQLNVNTKMERSERAGGMDVWKLVENLDKMQKDYLIPSSQGEMQNYQMRNNSEVIPPAQMHQFNSEINQAGLTSINSNAILSAQKRNDADGPYAFGNVQKVNHFGVQSERREQFDPVQKDNWIDEDLKM